MTFPPAGAPLEAEDVTTAVEAVRSRGLRLSSARRLVIEALFLADGPVSAEQIAGGLGGRLTQTDLASVYRNLDTLTQLGVVRHVHLGHGPGLYQRTSAQVLEYVACERCHAHRAISTEALDGVREAVRAASGYEARFTHFPIVGLCPECSP